LEDVKFEDSTESLSELLNFKLELQASVLKRFGTSKLSAQETAEDKRDRRIVTLDVVNDEYFILATLLDPRLKTGPFEGVFEIFATVMFFMNITLKHC